MSNYRDRQNVEFKAAHAAAKAAKRHAQRYDGFDPVATQDRAQKTAEATAALLKLYWSEAVRLLKDSRSGAEYLAEFTALTFPGAEHLGNDHFRVDLSEPLSEIPGDGSRVMHVAELLDYLIYDLRHLEQNHSKTLDANDKITLEYAFDAARDPQQWHATALLTAVALGQPVAPQNAPVSYGNSGGRLFNDSRSELRQQDGERAYTGFL